MVTWRCGHPGCGKHSSYGVKGSKEREFCGRHAKAGMVDVRSKRCGHPGCEKHPSYGADGTKKAEFCAGHRKQGMVNVSNKRCGHPLCTTRASFGADGSKKAEFCSRHALPGMVDVWSKRGRCTHPGCITRAYFGFHGSKKRELCGRHAKDGMVDLRTKKRNGDISVSDQQPPGRGQGGVIHGLLGESVLGPTATASNSGDGMAMAGFAIRGLAEETEETAAAARLFMGLRMRRSMLDGDDDFGSAPR